MRYTLILEFPDGRTETISFNILLNLFHFIKSRFSQIKKYKQTLTIIHGDKYHYKPNETNILIQNVKDYFKYIDNKLSKIVENRILKENNKLDEYSQVIQSLHKSFVELEKSLQEKTSTHQQVIEEVIAEKFQTISSDVNNKINSIKQEELLH